MGAWIEITRQPVQQPLRHPVAPHVGAWIEMTGAGIGVGGMYVAPHVGAWIEIILAERNKRVNTSRTPCGCVD